MTDEANQAGRSLFVSFLSPASRYQASPIAPKVPLGMDRLNKALSLFGTLIKAGILAPDENELVTPAVVEEVLNRWASLKTNGQANK